MPISLDLPTGWGKGIGHKCLCMNIGKGVIVKTDILYNNVLCEGPHATLSIFLVQQVKMDFLLILEEVK